MKIKILVALICSLTSVYASQVYSAQAKGVSAGAIINIIKQFEATNTLASSGILKYSLQSISCVYTSDSAGDGIPNYECSVASQKITQLESIAVFNTLTQELEMSDCGMGKCYIQIDQLSCSHDRLGASLTCSAQWSY